MEAGSTYQIHQKMEIPPIKAYVTEYHLYHGVCKACGNQCTADLLEGVNPDLLGDHAKAVISALSGFFHNSKRDVQRTLHDIFHMPISLGLVSVTTLPVTFLKDDIFGPFQEVEDCFYSVSEGLS